MFSVIWCVSLKCFDPPYLFLFQLLYCPMVQNSLSNHSPSHQLGGEGVSAAECASQANRAERANMCALRAILPLAQYLHLDSWLLWTMVERLFWSFSVFVFVLGDCDPTFSPNSPLSPTFDYSPSTNLNDIKVRQGGTHNRNMVENRKKHGPNSLSIIHSPTIEVVSKVNGASEWTSEWPSISVCILGCFRP